MPGGLEVNSSVARHQNGVREDAKKGREMDKKSIVPEGAARPSVPLSPGVKAGNMLFISGQVSLDPRTGKFVPGGIREQTELTLKNVQAVVEAAGGSMKDVVRTNCYLTDVNNFPAFNEVYRQFFSEPYPARTTTEVKLAGPFIVEIDAIAVLGE